MNAFERVSRWQAEWLETNKHWADKICWESAREIARRLDEPLGLESAPRDGSLFDVQQNGVPYLDCHYDSGGSLVQRQGYPTALRVFDMYEGHIFSWTPRPSDRIMPYSENSYGRKYVP